MKIFKNIFILILANSIQIANAQTYLEPPFKSKTNPRVSIYKIKTTPKATIIFFKYKSNFKGGTAITACINPEMYIKDIKTGKRYSILKAVNIPYCPENKSFNKENHQFKFYIHFERLPPHAQYIDVIEHILGGNSFNFIGVYLQPVA